jgi:hypothetical protein
MGKALTTTDIDLIFAKVHAKLGNASFGCCNENKRAARGAPDTGVVLTTSLRLLLLVGCLSACPHRSCACQWRCVCSLEAEQASQTVAIVCPQVTSVPSPSMTRNHPMRRSRRRRPARSRTNSLSLPSTPSLLRRCNRRCCAAHAHQYSTCMQLAEARRCHVAGLRSRPYQNRQIPRFILALQQPSGREVRAGGASALAKALARASACMQQLPKVPAPNPPHPSTLPAVAPTRMKTLCNSKGLLIRGGGEGHCVCRRPGRRRHQGRGGAPAR